jgi:hypothetical protein
VHNITPDHPKSKPLTSFPCRIDECTSGDNMHTELLRFREGIMTILFFVIHRNDELTGEIFIGSINLTEPPLPF